MLMPPAPAAGRQAPRAWAARGEAGEARQGALDLVPAAPWMTQATGLVSTAPMPI